MRKRTLLGVETALVTTLGVLLPVAAAFALVLGVSRRWPWHWVAARPRGNGGGDGGGGEAEDGTGVREPRNPLPSSSGAAAYAEPDERAA